MVYGAIDLHLRYSQIRIIDAAGAILRDRRVVTTRERLTEVFAGFGAMRIVVESATDSEWVAQTLEGAGHAGVVVDPNDAPMYGEHTRRVKTDRRDVAALAEANRRGWYRAAHRCSPAQRATTPAMRSWRGSGAGLEAPIQRVYLRRQRGDLRSVPGIGLVVARTFRAFVDRHERFAHAGQVSAAIGLVPREDRSAERRHRGHITKAGPRELRSLLIQAAWVCWRHPGSARLRTWVDRLAERRGRRIAVVALARRLSRILFALWRDDTTFEVRQVAMA